MAHGDFILAAGKGYKPFKKALEKYYSTYTPTLSNWPLEAFKVDMFLMNRFIKEPSCKYTETFAYKDRLRQTSPAPLLSNNADELWQNHHPDSNVQVVWGTIFSPYKMLDIPQDITKFSRKQEDAVFNKITELVYEMRSIGINAIANHSFDIIAENPYVNLTRFFIFVPNTKVVETDYPGMPLAFETDNKSRELMLAYLLHKEFIKADDPAIAETFPFNANHVEHLRDNMGTMLEKAKTNLTTSLQPTPS